MLNVLFFNLLASTLKGRDNRGFRTIEEGFHNGFADTVLVHDCWRSHFQTDVKSISFVLLTCSEN
jgi:hypothetical protein